MTSPSFFLTELLTSRLCHDLIAPIGSINTGLELFTEISGDHSTESKEILNLILQSAQTAAARVSFFRGAFGSGGSALTLGEARELIENYFAHSKLSFQWEEPFEKTHPLKEWGRLLLNTVLWIGECAPREGALHINTPQEDEPALSLYLQADPLILHEGALEALKGQATLQDITARTVPCYMIHLLVKERNNKLNVHQNSPTELLLEIKE